MHGKLEKLIATKNMSSLSVGSKTWIGKYAAGC